MKLLACILVQEIISDDRSSLANLCKGLKGFAFRAIEVVFDIFKAQFLSNKDWNFQPHQAEYDNRF